MYRAFGGSLFWPSLYKLDVVYRPRHGRRVDVVDTVFRHTHL